jgi:hypothetical protein
MARQNDKPKTSQRPERPLYVQYDVGWHFPWMLCGGVPQNPDIVKDWLRSRMPTAKPPEAKEISEIQEEVFDTLSAPTEERGLSVNGFQKFTFPGGSKPLLVMRASTIRAHLKDCARAVSRYIVGRVEGEAAFSTRFINCVYPDFPEQYWVRIMRDGKPLDAEDGWEEKPFSAMTLRGRISAFKRVAFVQNVDMRFVLRVFGDAVSEGDLRKVMEYGGTHGYGAERGVGHGRYLLTLLQRFVD